MMDERAVEALLDGHEPLDDFRQCTCDGWAGDGTFNRHLAAVVVAGLPTADAYDLERERLRKKAGTSILAADISVFLDWLFEEDTTDG